ncbi:MAG: helix-turn-helix domain-containing protein [Faecousia sp.]
MDAKKTGNFICENRKKQGMSQKELADKLGITDKAISKWERGISFPDISMLIPISKVLEISLYDLLTGGEDNGQE